MLTGSLLAAAFGGDAFLTDPRLRRLHCLLQLFQFIGPPLACSDPGCLVDCGLDEGKDVPVWRLVRLDKVEARGVLAGDVNPHGTPNGIRAGRRPPPTLVVQTKAGHPDGFAGSLDEYVATHLVNPRVPILVRPVVILRQSVEERLEEVGEGGDTLGHSARVRIRIGGVRVMPLRHRWEVLMSE